MKRRIVSILLTRSHGIRTADRLRQFFRRLVRHRVGCGFSGRRSGRGEHRLDCEGALEGVTLTLGTSGTYAPFPTMLMTV